MPDIQLRFHKDMLVLSAPIDALLGRQGINAARDREFLNLMEPDTIRDALKFEAAAGAQCIVTTTEDITQARLAHLRMDSDAPSLAKRALGIASDVKPQHVLVEIGTCGLPLDGASKSSLNENRSQYAGAARLFEEGAFDAFFLNGFTSITDLKCALMGVRQVSEKPIIASVFLGTKPPTALGSAAQSDDAPLSGDSASGSGLPFLGYQPLEGAAAPPVPASYRAHMAESEWPLALEAMIDLGASVVGFETEEPIDVAVRYARTAVSRTDVPVLAQLRVTQEADKARGKNLVPLADIEGYTPDTMPGAAVKLYGEGVQFLRATGLATPAYTGALAATVAGLDARSREEL